MASSWQNYQLTDAPPENGLMGLGGDVWSEFAFMVNYLGGSLNDTDVNGGGATSFWHDVRRPSDHVQFTVSTTADENGPQIYDTLYFSAAEWRTIDGGLNRLPLSFHPLVDRDTRMNRKVERIDFVPADKRHRRTRKVRLSWRDATKHGQSSTPNPGSRPEHFSSSKLHASTYDYALISAPFSVVRGWRLPFTLPTTITNAIRHLGYGSACKVALEYSARFWERSLARPIAGGCSTTSDIPGIGSICYPSYDLGGAGRASVLASYTTDDWPAALAEAEHVRYVLDAMAEIHGEPARRLFTGRYSRRCWAHDPLAAAGWAAPTIGQHLLYIPEYFKTYDGVSLRRHRRFHAKAPR